MFSNFFISIILAGSVGAWTYIKSSRHTGGNKQSSLVAAVAVGTLVFIFAITLLSVLF